MIQKNNLKTCRIEAGLEKVDLAKLSSVSVSTINNVEDRDHNIKPEIKSRLVNGLNSSSHTTKQYIVEEVFP